MRFQEPIELMTNLIQVLYSAETQLIIAQPRVITRCQSDELRLALSDHLEETKVHASRLEQASRVLGVPCSGRIAVGLTGILKEGDETLAHGADPALLDFAIMAACSLVERYEIGLYRAARALAQSMGERKAVGLFEATLAEEEKALATVTQGQEPALARTRAQLAG